MWSCCVIDIEFSFCEMKSSIDWVHSDMNIFNTTERTFKMVKMVNLICILPQLKNKTKKTTKTHNTARAIRTETWKSAWVPREGCGEQGVEARVGQVSVLILGRWGQKDAHRGAFLLSFLSQPNCKATSSRKGIKRQLFLR